MKKRIFSNKAFTLIEILVVVLIIGILAAIAVPKYQKSVITSQYSTIKELTNSIAQAEKIYYLANGSYTDNFNDLDIDMPGDKLNNSTNSNYVYPWGDCVVSVINEKVAYCNHTKANMRYQIYFSSAKYCVVLDTSSETDIRSQICQAETGKTTAYNKKEGSWIVWKY